MTMIHPRQHVSTTGSVPTLLFAMGDVGGARSLLPVIEQALGRALDCHVIDHGYVGSVDHLADASYHVCDPSSYAVQSLIDSLLPDAVLFTSSSHDTLALQVAVYAQSRAIPVVHLLDHWTNYSERLMIDDVGVVTPDIYAVMDDYARHQAIQAGIDKRTLVVTGTPALQAVKARSHWPASAHLAEHLVLIFVSEPVSLDTAADSSCSSYRGYTEQSVLKQLFNILNELNSDVELCVFPHPRENAVQLEHFVKTYCGELNATVVTHSDKASVMARANGVIGMASVLLYEMWLRGYPVMSLQPGLQLDALRFLSMKRGICFVDNDALLKTEVQVWIDALVSDLKTDIHRVEAGEVNNVSNGTEHRVDASNQDAQAELTWHQGAGARILDAVLHLCDQRSRLQALDQNL